MAEAVSVLRRALALHPGLAEAYGALALCGNGDEESVLKRAVRLRPDFVEAQLNLTALFIRQRRAEDALAAAEAGLRIMPGNAGLRRDRGAALVLLGRHDEAGAALQTVAVADPADAATWLWLGRTASDLAGREAALLRSWRVMPGDVEAGRALVGVRMEQWRWSAADRVLRRLLCDAPGAVPLMIEMAILLKSRDRAADAEVWSRRALAVAPADIGALMALAAALLKRHQTHPAESVIQRVAALQPDDITGYLNLAAALIERRFWRDAESPIRRALQLDRCSGAAYYNLGAALKYQGRMAESLVAYDEAVRLLPNDPRGRFNRALALLASGQGEQGFREHEWRWRLPGFPSFRRLWPVPSFPQKVWTGTSLSGQSILLWGEQGIGDEIWNAGFVPLVASRAAACLVECEWRLVPLFERSFPGVEIVERTVPPDPRAAGPELQCPTGSLPHLADVRRVVPAYLVADPERVARMRDRYRKRQGPVVGISWRSVKPIRHYSFAAGLAHWEPVLTLSGINFVSLQYGPVEEDLARIRERTGVDVLVDPEIDALNDLDGFAAQIAACDVVVSIANATVAMAHAVGRPVLAVLRHDQDDWRYLPGQRRTPWLPTVEAFWQHRSGGWRNVFEQVAEALSDRISQS